MARMNEDQISTLCGLGALVSANPSQGKIFTESVLKPRPVWLAGRWVEPVCSVPPSPSEFTKAVRVLGQVSKQLPTNPAEVGKMALIAEKMMRSKNSPRANAGRALLWAVNNRVIQDSRFKKEDRKISERDVSVVVKVIRRVLTADL